MFPIDTQGDCRPPTQRERRSDAVFRTTSVVFGIGILVLMFAVLVVIGKDAAPGISEFHFDFFTTSDWDNNKEVFGIAAAMWGTLYSSILALIMATVLGLAVAIVISQRFLPSKIELVLKNVIELLAAIPSVVYGLWGIFVVIPFVRPFIAWSSENLSFLPFFGEANYGPSMLPAAIVLAIMVLPTITAVSRDALVSVPNRLRYAAFGLGATRWECILRVVLPSAGKGIFGAVVLGFGRALGETMALAMLLGSANAINVSLFSPGNTLAALLANSFPEAEGIEVQALMYAAVVLLSITLGINIIGSWILSRTTRLKTQPKRSKQQPA